MKITIQFDDERDAIDAINGSNWKAAMWDLDQDLRGIVKHGYIGNREATEAEIDAADWCRKKIREHIESYNIQFDL
jgi:hypothetical protein